MPVRSSLATLLALTLSLSGCDTASTGPITVSVVGVSLKASDPNMGPTSAATDIMLSAIAQGLVSFDENDQVQPALAERWIVTDDGLSYIFRIREAEWANGGTVTGADVAASLKRSMAMGGRNMLRSLFYNVEAVIPMTGQVVEIRLKSPEPNFLQLLAQPDMAILRAGHGTGPYGIHSRRGAVIRLRPNPEGMVETASKPEAGDANDIRVRAERTALALARFDAGDADYLTGGTFLDLPLARAARPDTARFQPDPAYGLFGLAVSEGSEILGDANLRLALSIAIDREGLVQRFGVPNWKVALSVLPAPLDSAGPPSAMSAIQNELAERRARAQSILSNRGGSRGPLRIKVALPDGIGATLLFGSIASDWRRIGVEAVRVRPGQPADLFLIDEVAPVSSAVWYLQRLSCGKGIKCSDTAQAKLNEAMSELDLSKKRILIAEADAAQVATNHFIPIALPMRWSLVGTGLIGWRKSAFATHSLRQLR